MSRRAAVGAPDPAGHLKLEPGPSSATTPTRLRSGSETGRLRAAPESERAGAGVLGYAAGGEVSLLREGSSQLLCVADDPASEGFRVSCYYRELEPFMQRGRELRARGMEGEAVESVRFAEIESGELAYPDHPPALFTLAAARPPEGPTPTS